MPRGAERPLPATGLCLVFTSLPSPTPTSRHELCPPPPCPGPLSSPQPRSCQLLRPSSSLIPSLREISNSSPLLPPPLIHQTWPTSGNTPDWLGILRTTPPDPSTHTHPLLFARVFVLYLASFASIPLFASPAFVPYGCSAWAPWTPRPGWAGY